MQGHACVWMRGEVRGYEARGNVVGDGARAAEYERGSTSAGWSRGELGGLDLQASLVVFHCQKALVQKVRRRRGFDPASRFSEQGASVVGLELADVLGDGRLRDEKRLGGSREAALTVDL